ncbi:MAG: hypothetical protein AAF725_25810 [Acidobacteriota bacterium]
MKLDVEGQSVPHYKMAVSDPVGDTFGAGAVQLDLIDVSADAENGNLVVTLSFAGPVSAPDSGEANALDGFLDLDLDQDGTTGDVPWTDFLRPDDGTTGMGNEAYVDYTTYDSATGTAEVVNDITEQVIGMAQVAFGGTTVVTTVPLATLGDLDGALDLAVAVGTFDEPTDIAPNQGSISTSEGASIFLQDGRFEVSVEWRDFAGNTGFGRLVTQSNDSAVLFFFGPNNWEILLKVLDACTTQQPAYWVFLAGTTNVEFTATVTDQQAGVTRVYSNPLGNPADAVTDTSAFLTCP